MRTRVYAGRCWLPREWRDNMGYRRLQRPSGHCIVTGAVSRADVRHILASFLPMVEQSEDDPQPVLDAWSAQKMTRRLRYIRRPGGAKYLGDLIRRNVISVHLRNVYVYARVGDLEVVYRVEPGHRWDLTGVAEFHATTETGRDGKEQTTYHVERISWVTAR